MKGGGWADLFASATLTLPSTPAANTNDDSDVTGPLPSLSGLDDDAAS
ncbi:MAG: hypothetical protein KGO05_10120 [Chloroflexota bacterium]|nr:hypothetical protein [Chloroflexota bacterium]